MQRKHGLRKTVILWNFPYKSTNSILTFSIYRTDNSSLELTSALKNSTLPTSLTKIGTSKLESIEQLKTNFNQVLRLRVPREQPTLRVAAVIVLRVDQKINQPKQPTIVKEI